MPRLVHDAQEDVELDAAKRGVLIGHGALDDGAGRLVASR
jgi:hypothetical protein